MQREKERIIKILREIDMLRKKQKKREKERKKQAEKERNGRRVKEETNRLRKEKSRKIRVTERAIIDTGRRSGQTEKVRNI